MARTRHDYRRNYQQRKMTPEKWKRRHSHPLTMQMDLRPVRQIDLAMALKVSPTLINAWQTGVSMPNGLMMQKIVNYFGIEDREAFEQEWLDWKVGPDPGRSKRETLLNSHPIRHFLDWRGCLAEHLCKATKDSSFYVSPVRLRHWLNGDEVPRSSTELVGVARFMYDNGASHEDLPRLDPAPEEEIDGEEILPIDLAAFLQLLRDWYRKFHQTKEEMHEEDSADNAAIAAEDEAKSTPQYNAEHNPLDLWLESHSNRWQPEDIAARTGATIEDVEDWRTGKAAPSMQQIRILAAIMGIKIVDLLASFKASK